MANKKKQSNIFNDILNDEQYNSIEEMISSYKKDKSLELEVSFRKINYANYMRIIEYYIDQVDEADISSVDSLDISIMLPDGNTYRISLFDKDQTEKFLEQYANSKLTDIQKYLLSLNPTDDIEIMFKDRGSADRLYIEDLEMVFKITNETPLTKTNQKPGLNGTEKMLYRYKQRATFKLNDNIKLDITLVRESNNIWNLATKPANYEVEIEIMNSKINIDTFFTEIESVLRIVQDSDVPIGRSEAKDVIQLYQELLGLKHVTHLDSRNVVSIEAQHIVKFIPNRYAITDKADGERYFMFSITNGIYLISTNLVVKKTNLTIANEKYTNMILDGELIINEYGRMFLAFDVVYAEGVDYRFDTKYTLTHRLGVLNSIIDRAFGTIIPFTDYADKYKDIELQKIHEFYTKELKQYWKIFRTNLEKSKELFVTRKIYFLRWF